MVTCLNPGRKAECDPANSWCSTDPGTLWPSAPSAGSWCILADLKNQTLADPIKDVDAWIEGITKSACFFMMIVADFPRHLLNYATDMGPEGASLRHFLKVSVCRGF